MRLAVLSDVHGNLPALEAVIDDMQKFGVDHVVVAGDSIGWAPFSVAVMQRMMVENWAIIRGNHEMYMLECGRPEVPEYRRNWSIPRWLNTVIPPDIRHVIAALPDTLTLLYRDVPPIRVLHGSLCDHWRGIYYQTTDDEVADMLAGAEQETVIVGHTHLPMDRQSGRWHIFNPGSVGVPLDGVHGASYLLLESDGGPWQPTFRHVTYDLTPNFGEFERLDFIKLHGPTARLLIEEIRMARPLVVGFYRWLNDHHANQPETLELVETFLADPEAMWHYLHPFYRLNLPEHVSRLEAGQNGG